MKKIFLASATLILLGAPLLASAQSAAGALSDSLNTAADQAGLPRVSIVQVVAIIINSILSILGIIFVVLLVLGGFRWMTSQGNADQVKDAKSLIRNGLIGLIIVLTSYAIATFVVERITGAVGAGGVDSGGSGTS